MKSMILITLLVGVIIVCSLATLLKIIEVYNHNRVPQARRIDRLFYTSLSVGVFTIFAILFLG